MVPPSGKSSTSGAGEKLSHEAEKNITESELEIGTTLPEKTTSETDFPRRAGATYSSVEPRSKGPLTQRMRALFARDGPLRPFRLLKQDIRNIRKRYISDWTLFNQLVFASAIYVFFTNLLPGITFASDLYVRTGTNWGTIEVVFSTGLCGIIFSLFSIQPLTILGVTGPFAVLAENIYELCETSFHVDFLSMMAWSLIHAGWMHSLLAIFNAHDWTMKYVTTFSADIFSLLNSVIYFHKAVQELQRNHDTVSFASFLYSVIGAVGTFLLAVFLSTANSWKPLFHRYIRMGLAEYAAAISIIIFIGMPQIGELDTLDKATLVVQTSFRPSDPARSTFFVHFWKLPVPWIFASILPGAIITLLFYFDHEISSIICTLPRYGTKKPGGFAWDIMLLGTTTALCGVLGIPPANGLLPQAPLHAESLLHTITSPNPSTSLNPATGENEISFEEKKEVYEQRWSPFMQAAGILVFVSPPFQHVLGLTPTSVLAGLFLFMGEQSLAVNPILYRIFYMLTPPSELPPLPPGVRNYWGVHGFTAVQIIMTGIIFYVTLTVAAPAFPVPTRLLLMNKIWSRDTLRLVDAWACRDGTPEDEEDEQEATPTPSSSPSPLAAVAETPAAEKRGKGRSSGGVVLMGHDVDGALV
ncbi:HCO3- transporter family protein [Drepanopeziza brunnea f. sp. 'multigermtubi' MB_m1]|uniref:HCO3-transporter family protein n=1 Tax=Marssonina brunnea f. sp. multigermtubi (strain MB_m1) TaxID=1072389 RepID=K1WJV3_MARBU|nr:HCO3- transporter family protein [Drepanopeziza brunnea f. sp. 'multigermtubi' MB_m1]EKD12502.1 HCO3- transporter family protein [Drepanopeziza brunnea f. sp. 'multigermtubi' MB_m1]